MVALPERVFLKDSVPREIFCCSAAVVEIVAVQGKLVEIRCGYPVFLAMRIYLLHHLGTEAVHCFRVGRKVYYPVFCQSFDRLFAQDILVQRVLKRVNALLRNCTACFRVFSTDAVQVEFISKPYKHFVFTLVCLNVQQCKRRSLGAVGTARLGKCDSIQHRAGRSQHR